LDPAANVTVGASAPDDSMDVERKQAADWPHWPDRGNGLTRRDRLERRLFRDSEREAELAAAQETIRRIAEATAAKAAEIERLERAVGRLNGSEPEPEPEPVAPTPGPEAAESYVLFAWTAAGYALHETEGDAPLLGAQLSVNGSEYVVAKVGRSPLPGDSRRCIYLDPR
jgi:hypothetical protein